MTKRRVVVTGMGMISPLGIGNDVTWKALLAVRSGIGNGINEGMGHPQTSIMRLRHLTNHQTGPGIFGFRISDFS